MTGIVKPPAREALRPTVGWRASISMSGGEFAR
jgi:hypothetical protein